VDVGLRSRRKSVLCDGVSLETSKPVLNVYGFLSESDSTAASLLFCMEKCGQIIILLCDQPPVHTLLLCEFCIALLLPCSCRLSA